MALDAEAFVERMFVVDGREVRCRFFRPEPDRGDFRCFYEIEWPERVRRRGIAGVDEIQALLLAMQTAHAELLVAREKDGRQVTWFGERSLGLPVASILRDLDPENSF